MQEINQENERVSDQLATDENKQEHFLESNQDNSQGTEKPKSAEYNFKEMRRTVDELKNHLESERKEKEEIKNQLNQFRSGFKKVFEPEENNDVSGDELLTVGEFEKRLHKQRLQQEIEEVPKVYPDYYDVIKFVEPLVKENPALLDAIQNSRNPRLAAYQLVKNSYAYKSTVVKHDAKDIERNLSKPVPSEAIAGGSGIDAGERTMSLAEKAEVWKMARKYARGA